MASGVYFKFGMGGNPAIEVGPFEYINFDGCVLTINGTPALEYYPSDGKWHVTDHEALGESALEGWENSVILGQAK